MQQHNGSKRGHLKGSETIRNGRDHPWGFHVLQAFGKPHYLLDHVLKPEFLVMAKLRVLWQTCLHEF